MIVREEEDGYILIRQHDHGRVSGDFADHWKDLPDASTRIGIRYHDVGWEELDKQIRWNPMTGKPYTFENYPMEQKLDAYTSGINRVERMDAFSACLCSMHFVSFFSNPVESVAIQFVEREKERQQRLVHKMKRLERDRLAPCLRMLKLCDDLSLFLCLNPPGKNEHPWYRKGFWFGDQHLCPIWESPNVLRIVPSLFATSFEVVIPYQMIRFSGERQKEGVYRIQVIGGE
ncbi:DUF3891 family protein [Melghirimyces algeriensis]|uniref:DUF3891 family protein n=1 Tax=Melghirimyces algeriensis TaxID=910412 RepID=A0A521EK83_9BACL|nr:DUF3891 family protein [Melghirimyces algeriensis]SMO84328.1 Protein of unknown function [Melghirimyces algeriensis]